VGTPSHKKLKFIRKSLVRQILKERRCFICPDLMEQDPLERVLWQGVGKDSAILPEVLMVQHRYWDADIEAMAMDRALVVALEPVLGMVLARDEAMEEALAGVKFTLPPEESMVQPTMPLMRALTPCNPKMRLIHSRVKPMPWRKNLMP
jgi:hypothetical protein